jgi:hypothetical protein
MVDAAESAAILEVQVGAAAWHPPDWASINTVIGMWTTNQITHNKSQGLRSNDFTIVPVQASSETKLWMEWRAVELQQYRCQSRTTVDRSIYIH